MNKYPAWVNAFVLVVVMAGILLALPNLYGRAPAVQLANDNVVLTEDRLAEFVRVVENAGIEPAAAFIQDGRAVLRFVDGNDQDAASQLLRASYDRELGVASTLAPATPAWIRTLASRSSAVHRCLRAIYRFER